jgi:threonine dehydrogenase-like Zn-dependent dehydrogenase
MPWACEHPQHRFLSPDWGNCKTALAIGAGPLGLLAIALLRLAGVYTFAADIVDENNPKVHLVKQMEAEYIDGRDKTAKEIAEISSRLGNQLDMIFEASGAAATALELINYMWRSSIYVMTGIPRQELNMQVDAAQLVRQIVRYNQVVVGSVNSNRSHFEMALKDIPQINSRFGNMLEEMITSRYRLQDYEKIFTPTDSKHIKRVVEVEPWN